jgi:hypothetical protein
MPSGFWRALATDETQAFAPMPNSRLLAIEKQPCPHTTHECELPSQIT